jgi:glycosyltransferase involved in cell wall biosynthesis
MHIVFLNPQIEYFSPVSGGAVATIAMQYAREMISRGHKVTVLSPVDENEVYAVGDMVPLHAPKRHELTRFQRAVSKIQTQFCQWDAAFYRWYKKSFMTALRKLPSTDAIVLFNDFVSPKYLKRAAPGARIVVNLQNEQGTRQSDFQSVLESVHHFVACSRHIRNWTSTRYKIPDDKISTINNGIDLVSFKPRADFLRPRQVPRVLFIGRIDPNKGPDIIADAVGTLKAEGVQVDLTVAGGLWFYGHGKEMDNPYFRELKGKLDAVGGRYVGHVTRPHVPELVRDHDIVAVLSRSNDPNPLVSLEGMASGCAVLASDRGGLPDTCDGAGIMVNPDDPKLVADSLRRLITDSAHLADEKQRSVRRAARASWTDKAAELEEVLSR